MKKWFDILVLGVILLAGCSGKPEALPTSLPTKITPILHLTSTIGVTPTEISSSTPSPAKTIPSITPTNTPSPTTDSVVTQNCVPVQPNPPEQHAYEGKIAIENSLLESDDISLYDLGTGTVAKITDNGRYPRVSLDHTLYAYKDFSENRLKVFFANGKQVMSLPWKDDWRLIERWFDNQNIMITVSGIEEWSGIWDFPPDLLLIDAFTGQSRTLLSDHPDIYTDWEVNSGVWPWQGYSGTIYSSDLKRVVYLGGVFPGTPEYGLGYILYGIPEQKKLAEIPDTYLANPPLWAPNGTEFIVEGNRELYLVSYNGVISQITHLNPAFDLQSGTGLRYIPANYSWSPDSRHVAFWLNAFGMERYTLAIIDTLSGEITDYCVSRVEGNKRNSIYPVWSPDGKKLVVAGNISEGEYRSGVILVDLEQHTSFVIATDYTPSGWLIEP